MQRRHCTARHKLNLGPPRVQERAIASRAGLLVNTPKASAIHQRMRAASQPAAGRMPVAVRQRTPAAAPTPVATTPASEIAARSSKGDSSLFFPKAQRTNATPSSVRTSPEAATPNEASHGTCLQTEVPK